MKDCYKQELVSLTDLVQRSRDKLYENYKNFEQASGSLIHLGDPNYGAYNTMVETNEYRAAKAVERIAVALLDEYNIEGVSLYPIEMCYANLPTSEQAKSRPFQIVILKNNVRTGIVFCNLYNAKKYERDFRDGKYSVDILKVVILALPDALALEANYTLINKLNEQIGCYIERVPIFEFWEEFFSKDECEELQLFAQKFNKNAAEIIAFNTVVSPTEKALEKFKEKCGEYILSYNYDDIVPDSVYFNQVEIMKQNYINRDLWKAMIGKSDFAISFISSEWYYNVYQLTENLDLSGIVTGYLKSIEQLLFSIIQLSEGTGITIKSKGREVVDFTAENEDIIDKTLWALQQVIRHNNKLLDINSYAKEYLISTIDKWRDKQRNGYFHKHNLHSIDKVDEIRDKAIQLYFLILGSCTIRDDQLERLGIFK